MRTYGPTARAAVAASAFVAVYAVWLLTRLGGDDGLRLLSEVGFQLPPLAATLACAVAALRTTGRERAGWAAFAAGLACWAAGEWIWAGYDLFFLAEPPLFSFADPIFYAGYPLLMVGAVLLVVPERSARLGSKSLLDALLLTAVLGVVAWRWLLIPIYDHSDVGTFDLIVTLGYPVLDLGIIAVIIYSFYRTNEAITLPLACLVLGGLAVTAADGAYLYFQTVSSYDVWGNPVELGWVVSYAAFFLAGVARVEAAGRQPGRQAQIVLGKELRSTLGIALPYAALLPMLALFSIDVARAAPNETLAAGLIAATVLVAGRHFLMLHELARSRAALERLNEKLQDSMSAEYHLARTDALTSIPNRRLLEETIAAEVSRAKRYGHKLSVLMADVDHLKEVNDQHSHQRGDGALQLVARLARESCRQADLVGRYGGDEFTFVLPATDSAGALLIAERFRAAVSQKHADGVTVSVGVAEWDGRLMYAAGDLLGAADHALYAAKSAGRNRVVVAPPAAADHAA